MKRIGAIFFFTLLVCSLQAPSAFGQREPKVTATYFNNVIPRPFFVRWIKDLTGPGFGQREKLILKNDGTFSYSYHDRYCGTFNSKATGKWVIVNDSLVLTPDDNCSIPWTSLTVKGRKLYSAIDPLNSNAWAMKKR